MFWNHLKKFIIKGDDLINVDFLSVSPSVHWTTVCYRVIWYVWWLCQLGNKDEQMHKTEEFYVLNHFEHLGKEPVTWHLVKYSLYEKIMNFSSVCS